MHAGIKVPNTHLHHNQVNINNALLCTSEHSVLNIRSITGTQHETPTPPQPKYTATLDGKIGVAPATIVIKLNMTDWRIIYLRF